MAGLGKTREEGNALVLELLSHYEGTFENPNRGLPFPEIYDEETVEPKENWLAAYHQVRDAVIGIGLDLDGGWRKARHG